MAKRPQILFSAGFLILFVGITALVAKSGHNTLFQALLSALFFLLAALYCASRSFERAEVWYMVIPAGFCLTVAAIILLRHFGILKTDLLWVLFFGGAGLTLWVYWKNRSNPAREGWAKKGALLFAFLAFVQYMRSLHLVDTMTLTALLLLVGGAWLLLLRRK